MNNLTFENIFLMLLGMAIAGLLALSKFKDASKRRSFNISIFLEQNIIPGLISLCGALASVILMDAAFHALGIKDIPEPLKAAHAFVSGLLPQLFIDRIKKLFL